MHAVQLRPLPGSQRATRLPPVSGRHTGRLITHHVHQIRQARGWGTDEAAAEKGRQCQRRERLMTFEFEKHSKLMAESGMHASLVRLRPQNKNM